MRILFIISSKGFYGAENVVSNLAGVMKKNGGEPYLICLKSASRNDPEIHAKALSQGIESRVIVCKRKLDIKAILEIRSFIKKKKIDLLHTHNYKSDVHGFIAARLAGVPVMATLHGWTSENGKVRVYEMIDRFFQRRMDALVAVSPEIFSGARGLGISPDKITLIHNAVDTVLFDPVRGNRSLREKIGLLDCFVAGTAGRLAREKGQIYLLKAFKEVCRSVGNVRLLIAGDGDQRESLMALTSLLGIKDKVIFSGEQRDMPSVYKCMDVFILPSLTEGVPMALLEAMSMGLPVIASRVGGIPDIIDRGGGLLVEPGDVKGLTGAILTVMKRRVMRSRMAAKGRERVINEYSLDNFYARYRGAYDKAIGRARVKNVLSVDVEDYFQVENFKKVVGFSDWPKYEARVVNNTGKILGILANAGVRATFFVLGWTAERFPALVKLIRSSGHEVASHGYAHDPIFNQTRRSFRSDLVRSKKILEDIIGEPVLGYRAPTFSLTERSRWALEILKEEGFKYDSSVLPVSHKTRGIPGAQRFPYAVPGGSAPLWEFPVSTFRMFNRNLSFAGGGYFRLYPYRFVKHLIGEMNRENHPAVVYVHPWELDPSQPRIKADRMSSFKHYVNLSRTEDKLTRLLEDFDFGPIKEVFKEQLEITGGVAI
ncbi:MAG: DUF3473 domain-containing protein [Candidatus Omnitrophica bacterium]|nr:DUF3473 domain-containing protein [Candidatus Omnitrophota bacterium]